MPKLPRIVPFFRNLFSRHKELPEPAWSPIPPGVLLDDLTGHFISEPMPPISIALEGKHYCFASKENLRLWMASRRMLVGYPRVPVRRDIPDVIHKTMRKKSKRKDDVLSVVCMDQDLEFKNISELCDWLTEEVTPPPFG